MPGRLAGELGTSRVNVIRLESACARHLLKGPEADDHTLYASHTVRKNNVPEEPSAQNGLFRCKLK